MVILTLAMVACYVDHVLTTDITFLKVKKDEDRFRLFCTKVLCTIAVHLNLTPWFQSGLDIMKFVSNHPSKFDY
jgi:hypothetical protein